MRQPRMDSGDDVPALNSVADGYWYKNDHPMRVEVAKMPWHTDDKPFGITQEDWEKIWQPLEDQGLCYCGRQGKYNMGRWYCDECWELGVDDPDDGYAAHLDLRSA